MKKETKEEGQRVFLELGKKQIKDTNKRVRVASVVFHGFHIYK